jgi:hypothetical protein
MTRSRDSPGRRGGPASRFRNTTETINAVMYSLLSEFRDGGNVVATRCPASTWNILSRSRTGSANPGTSSLRRP